MIDDDSKVDPRSIASDDHFDEAMLYDFAKFLTTLALLLIGGVLTLTQTAPDGMLKPPIVAMVVVFIALAGILALSAAGKIAKTNVGNDKGPSARRLLQGANGFLGAGAGGFLVMWWIAI